jgi:hypothetical protein
MNYTFKPSCAANKKSLSTTALSKKINNENLVILRSFEFFNLEFLASDAGPNIRKILRKGDALIHFDIL